jgi:ABC-type multidrug transport system fused ATPase/permease subunit
MELSARQYWDLLRTYLKPQWLKVLLLAFLLFGSISLQLLNPLILRYFIDVAKSIGPSNSLTNAAVLFICVVLVNQLLSALSTYFSADVGWTATNNLRSDLALHCLRLDLRFHHEHPPGELLERIDGDVGILSNFFSQFVIRVLSNLLLLTGIVTVLLVQDWRLGLGLMVYAFIGLVLLTRIQWIAAPYFHADRKIAADIVSFWEERLGALEDICANGAKPYVMRRYYQLLRSLLHIGRKSLVMFRAFQSASVILLAIVTAFVFVVGVDRLNRGTITIGTIYLAFHLTVMAGGSLFRITEQMEMLQRARASLIRIYGLYHTGSGIRLLPADEGSSNLQASRKSEPLSVEFHDVSFAYQPGVPVLQDLSFRLAPNRVLGLLGRTGSGKTTVARLLVHFYEPDRGTIHLGGKDLRRIPPAEMHRQVGLVTQEVQLFHASVRDNLTFFDRTISDDRILNVIEELGLLSWYDTLPHGLDTELAAGGKGLSAGEAQLLAFTRVFLQDPGLVILDEASSRLDPATEHLITRAVDRLLTGRTAIIIAHQLKTVQRADEIMILENGKVIEHGSRELLADDPFSRFYQLLRTGSEQVPA